MEFFSKRTGIIAVIVAVAHMAGWGGGFLLNDFFSFRIEQRQEFRAEFDEAEEIEKKILRDLQLFSDQALGRKSATDNDRAALKAKINRLYKDVNDVAIIVPEAQSEFDAYADAMIELQNAALKMTGPIDAKAFVESVSKFFKTQQDFNKKIRELRGNYLTA